MKVWPLSRKRAAPAPPPKDLPRVSEELEQLDVDISRARTKLQGLRDVPAILELSALLRRRFFLEGQTKDISEFLALSGSVPPTLEEIGTASLTFRPELSHNEHLWVQLQPWLQLQGYALLPRYNPNWVPSWVASPSVRKIDAEDGRGSLLPNVNAAVRLKDGVTVWLKHCSDLDDQETGIYLYFASEPRRSDPRNRCCPLLDILRAPSTNGRRNCILVVPLLRAVDTGDPDPETVKDMLDGILQLAEGLEFLHEHNVAHRDIHLRNVMFDASKHIPGGWHPFSRSVVSPTPGAPRESLVLPYSLFPVNYYYIDFGLSIQFPSKFQRQRVVGTAAMNRTVPELSNTVPYDPFATDIRMFGDLLKQFQEMYIGLEFLDPLISQLVPDDPSLRLDAPSMFSALRALIARQHRWTLLRPLLLRTLPSPDAKTRLRYLLRLFSLRP